MKKITLTLALLLTVILTSFSQSIQERTRNSDLVIEGKVTGTKSYWNDEKKQILTSNLVEVRKVYKGILSTDEIEIITIGGTTEDAFRIAFHSLRLAEGEDGVFFLRESDRPSRFSAQEKYETSCGEAGFVEFHFEPFNPPASDIYGHYTDPDAELAAEIEKATSQAPRILSPSPQRLWPFISVETKNTGNGPESMDSEVTIEYTFENPQLTSASTIEFDVYAHVNSAGIGYRFGEADVSISYSTEMFGESIVTENLVQVTKGSMAQASIYQLSLSDTDESTFRVEVGGGCENPSQAYVFADATQQLFHVALTVLDWGQLAEVDFDKLQMSGNSKYWTEGYCFPFDTIIVDNPLHFEGEVGITYDFDNFSVTGTGSNRALEFDIVVSADSVGTEFHTGEIYLNYSLDAFAFNIVGTGNFTLTDGSFLQNNNYTVTAENWGGGTIRLTVEADDASDLEVLPTAPVQLLHLKLVGDDCDEDAGLYFDEATMAGKQFHHNGGLLMAYDPVTANGAYFQPACSETLPIIFDFNPKVVSAGIGNEITITGLNFRQDTGKVIFRDANSSSTLYDKTLPVDIVEWSDEVITTKVPSILENLGVAGTGRVGVETADTLSTIRTKTLMVNYAVINTISEITDSPIRINLIDQDSVGGYQFYIDTFLFNKPGLFLCIERALMEWSCRTGVTWEIIGTVNTGSASLDGKNIIFAGGNSGDTLMVTYVGATRHGDCTNSNNEFTKYLNDIDIEINPAIPWEYDCNRDSVPGTEVDFFSVILHELGHAHMLVHALPEHKLMRPGISYGEMDNFAPEDVNGGLDVMGHGVTHLGGDCPAYNDPDIPAGCTNATEETGSPRFPSVTVYPNPFTGSIFIESEKAIQPYSVNVYDPLGRPVFRESGFRGNRVEVDLGGTNLPPGVYILQIQWDNGAIGSTIIKI